MRLKRLRRAVWDVVAICSDRGDCPLEAFLTDLEGDLVAEGRKMAALLERVAQLGPAFRGDHSKELTEHLLEFRTRSLRVIWFYDAGRVVVCSHGFVKRTQKTPAVEISRGTTARQRYFAAKSEGRLRWEDGS